MLAAVLIVVTAASLNAVGDSARKFLGDAGGLFKATFLPQDNFTEVAVIPLNSGAKEETAAPAGNFSYVAAAPENLCSFDSGTTRVAEKVIFNEIAWMGTSAGYGKEWIEIKNISDGPAALAGFQILDKDEQIEIVFPKNASIPTGGFYLLERGEDAVPGAKADLIYSGNLRNSDEELKFFDGDCNLIDEVAANPSWPAGDNKNKFTMERNSDGAGWHTSSIRDGTPRKENSPAAGPTVLISPISPIGFTATTSDNQNAPQTNFPAISSNLRVLISEVMAGTDNDSKYEFIELYNPNSSAVDMTGWSIKKRSSTGSESSFVVASRLEGKIIPAGSYFLIVNPSGWSGNLSADLEWPSSYTLADKENGLYLYESGGTVADSIFWTEIPRSSSYERADFEGNQFRIQPTPSPRGSK